MKVLISVAGPRLDAPFDPRFGRAACFCLVDSDSGEWSAHLNPALTGPKGAGVRATRWLRELGAEAVISGAYGRNAFRALSPAGVTMYLGPSAQPLSGAEALDLLRGGALDRAEAATHEGLRGGGRSCSDSARAG